jgi:nicotinamide-nucleotide amidase
VLHNQVGTAPGMWMKRKHRFISLPGVPYEMKYLVERNHSKVVKEYERPYIIHKTITDRDESLISERIEAWENSLPQFLKLTCQVPKIRLRIRLGNKQNCKWL